MTVIAVFSVLRFHHQLPLDPASPSARSPGRLLPRWAHDKYTSPLSVTMNPGQESPSDEKKLLLATKWTATSPPLPHNQSAGGDPRGRSPSDERKHLLAKLHQEYELALNSSQRERASSRSGVERRSGLVAKWKDDHLGSRTLPDTTAPATSGGGFMAAADEVPIAGSTNLGQSHQENLQREREASSDTKLVNSLFFIE